MVLSINQIPFRYECELSLNDAVVYPDFTIMHPRTEELFYWEHFGMMDNPRYAKRAGEKLQMYIVNGLIPTVNVITTYETTMKPLDTESLDRIVKEYFG